MGDVIGDLNSRRGKVGKMEQRGPNQVIEAEVPLSEMFGYSTDLRSKTQGRATYTMHFGSYQPTPGPCRKKSSLASPDAEPQAHPYHQPHQPFTHLTRSITHGQGEVRAEQASYECGDDGSY
ncbi:MAG: hypothetical protein R2704_00305 [Microthrixaceae bacterium]